MKARWLRVLSCYEVRLVEKALLGQYIDPDTGRIAWNWGDCDLNDKVIRVRRDLSFVYQVWTLIHEMTHAEYPQMEEDDVYELGDRRFNHLSRRSWKTLSEALRSAR